MNRTPWKRWAALVLALTLTAAACGGRDDSSSDDSGGGGSGSDTTEAGEAAFIDPADDCTEYEGTMGVSGDTIKVGTIRPQSGPYSIYDQVTSGMEAYFKAANEAGGITAGDGKTYKIELVKENDEYDPAKTPPLAKKLVEQDQVFALVGVIGTENNKSIRDYLNEKCVPNISLATGSPEWGKADEYPWYISALPSYAAEANAWVEYLKETKPEAKIALLYQDDDFGKAYQAAITKAIEGTDMTLVAEESFNPLAGGTTEAAVTKLSQSGADVFVVGIGGTPCPRTLSFMPDTWTPETIVSVTCASKTALSLAGGKDQGVIVAQPTLDPADPADATNPKVVEFAERGVVGGLTPDQVTGGIAAPGWGFAALFAKALEETPEVDRAAVMNTLFSLEDANFGLARDEVTVNTDGADDPWVIEGFRIAKRTGEGWTELTPVTNNEGKSNSYAGN